MTADNHNGFRENLAAYALGALDAPEAAALEAHLQTCDTCPEELAEFQRLSAGLLFVTSPQDPSPAVRRRLVEWLPSARGSRQPRRAFSWSFAQAMSVAALAVLLIINVLSFVQVRGLQLQQAELKRRLEQNQTALAMLAGPGSQSLPVASAPVVGTVLVNKETNTAALILSNVSPLDANETYQIWLIQPDGGRVSGGLFDAAEAGAVTIAQLTSRESLETYIGLGVTVEPAGGSTAPTGARLFAVEF